MNGNESKNVPSDTGEFNQIVEPPEGSLGSGDRTPIEELRTPHDDLTATCVEDRAFDADGSSFGVGPDPAASWSADKLPTIGRFQLLREVGRGTYGTVFKAFDTELDRTVAIKIPRGVWLSNDESRNRFFREARSAARLRHPGIVPVLETGHSGDFHYLVSELVEGVTLAEALTKQNLGFRRAARLIADVADALQHAHDQGVIHRDLKPSNIMIAPDGTPRVMDFGLAKRTGGDETMTLEGQVVGTPAYMSPEQAAGEVHRVDRRSDVYCLGVILYQLLTGERPFRGNQQSLLRQVIYDDPRQPRSLNDRVPRDLETICEKSMAKELDKRYPTAATFAADLRRWLKDEPIEARPNGPIMKGWRWVKRNPSTAALASCTLVLLILISVVSTTLAIAISKVAAKERQTAIAAIESKTRERTAKIDAQKERDSAEDARAAAVREQEIANRVSDFMMDLFQASDPVGTGGFGLRNSHANGGELTVREILQVATERIQSELVNQPLARAKLMATLGNVHRSRGEFDQAEKLITRAEELWSDHRGDELGHTRIQFLLGWLRHDLGDQETARKHYEEALHIQERILGREHLETMSTLFNYAWLLADTRGSYDERLHNEIESERLFREVLRVRRDQLGKGHRDVGVAMTGLLVVLMDRDRNDEVKELLLDAVQIFHAQENGEQLGIAISLFVTGNLARKKGRLPKAISDYRKAIEISKEVLGDKHPLVAISLGELAGTLKQAGETDEAELVIIEALDIGRAITREGHPHMIPALAELADWNYDRRDFRESEDLYREAIEVWRRFPTRHKNVAAEAMLRLASICFDRARFDQAKILYEDVIEIEVPEGRKADWHYPSEAQIGLARLLREQGDP